MKKHMSGLAMAAAMGAAVVSGTGVASASDAPSVSLAAASAAAASSCGAGYVCIYEGDIFDGGTDHPVVYRFYRYGTYNLSGIIGEYTVRNCQTGGARVALYSGYNATGSVLWDLGDNCAGGLWTDLTPVNSVRVYE